MADDDDERVVYLLGCAPSFSDNVGLVTLALSGLGLDLCMVFVVVVSREW